MKTINKHVIIGAVICLATMLLFLAFSSQLPENIPIQFALDGSVNREMPKSLFIFVMPIIFAAISVSKGLSLAGKENTAVYKYYIIPGILFAISVAMLVFALNM